MNREFAQTAALFSDPARAAMLMVLLDGSALPAGQLAMIANVAPQTASSHLSKLVAARLLTLHQQGRHRYYRLANAEVASLIEAIMAISPGLIRKPVASMPPLGSLEYARTCYSHLAGRVAVNIAEALGRRKLIVLHDQRRYEITQRGREWFEQAGIVVNDGDMNDPRFARPCLDWTERHFHVAGRLGSSMLARFQKLKWVAPVRNSRAVRLTMEGQRNLADLLATV